MHIGSGLAAYSVDEKTSHLQLWSFSDGRGSPVSVQMSRNRRQIFLLLIVHIYY